MTEREERRSPVALAVRSSTFLALQLLDQLLLLLLLFLSSPSTPVPVSFSFSSPPAVYSPSTAPAFHYPPRMPTQFGLREEGGRKSIQLNFFSTSFSSSQGPEGRSLALPTHFSELSLSPFLSISKRCEKE